jgi:hypothetical protein
LTGNNANHNIPVPKTPLTYFAKMRVHRRPCSSCTRPYGETFVGTALNQHPDSDGADDEIAFDALALMQLDDDGCGTRSREEAMGDAMLHSPPQKTE